MLAADSGSVEVTGVCSDKDSVGVVGCWMRDMQWLLAQLECLLFVLRVLALKEVCWSEPPVIIEKSQWLNKDKYISIPGRESSAPTCRIDRNA